MKKCLYDDCLNTEDTPDVEFHEVFDSSQGNKTLNLHICSHHLNKEFDKQSTPALPTQKVPANPKADGAEKHAGSLFQKPDGSSAQKSAGNGAQGGSASTTAEKPKKNRHCCAAGCDVSLLTHPDVGLFKFYPSKERFEKWCLIADLKIRETRLAFCLCARHFHSDCFVDDERRNLKASSDPMYPTGPLNKATGNYCPYTKKEPPLIIPKPPKPEVIVIDDDESTEVSKNLGAPAKPGSLPTNMLQTPDHGYAAVPQSTPDSAKTGNFAKVEHVEDSPAVKKCCHVKCDNTSMVCPNVVFFRFPPDGDPRSDIWSKAAGFGRTVKGKIHKRQPGLAYWLCSEHFDRSQFENDSTLKAAALPRSCDPQLPPFNMDNYNIHLKCDAAYCPNSYRQNPAIKFFTLERRGINLGIFDEWKEQIGGLKQRRVNSNYFNVCEYHFPEKAFIDTHHRLRLARSRDYRLFPYGPLNPKTRDFCPLGQEELSILYHKERIIACCVKGCFKMSSLFKFPYYDYEAFEIWCERIGINRIRYNTEYITDILCVCELHFDPRCKVLDTTTNDVLLTYGALPTLRLPNYHGKSDVTSVILKRNNVPPNGEELAHSLLIITKPGEPSPPKRVNEKESDDVDVTPAKLMKHNVAITPILPLQRMGQKKLQNGKLVVANWAPVDLAASDVGEKPCANQQAKLPSAGVERRIDAFLGKVERADVSSPPNRTNDFSEDIKQQKPNIFPMYHGPKKRGPKKKFEPDENRPSMTVKQFLDEFLEDTSPPPYSLPPSPDVWNDPLARTRDAGVQTDSPPEPASEAESEVSKKTNKKALEKLRELTSIDVGNEVDIAPIVVDNKMVDKNTVWSQVTKENALENALMGLFNSCKAGEDNAFSSLSDQSTIPEPGIVGGYDHQYSTYNTVNVIRSAAQLCEFNSKKVLQLEQLIRQDEKDFAALEDTLVAHLGAVMCITGLEFIRKCFDRVLQDAISREKVNEKKSDATVQVFDGKKKTAFQVPMTIANLQTQYSKETKQMSKAMLAYSGRAFQLLRQIADLPQPYLIRDWMTYRDGSPGYSDQAFAMLRQNYARTNKARICSLSVVDVPLQKDAVWDGQRSFGYEDFGFGSVENDSIREATKAVVFYVKILTENKKLPVGYCLADNLTPQVRANLIIQYITHLDSVGLKCIALVCDYSVMAYETFVELGAFIDELDTGWFHHPLGKGVRVMCFTDVFQNIRALSDLWAEKKTFRHSPKAEPAIDWDHITEGDEFLKTPSRFLFAPAMSKFLSELKLLKTRVQKDPLTANKYNAVMLTILRDLAVKKFASTSQTIRYLESLTAVTDIFSSNHPYDTADRRPLNIANCSKIQSRLTSLSAYFSGLCFGSGTKILTTNRKMPVAMLKMNICSLRNLSRRIFYGEKHRKYEFYSKSLSLEDITATIATMCGGAKRLVTASEFRRGFKKFMAGYSLTPSERLMCDLEDNFRVKDVCIGFNNTYLYEYTPLKSVSESALEFLTENVMETWLENVKCIECSQLVQKGILTSRDYTFDGNVVQDIHKMIRTAETCLAEHSEIPCDSYDAWFNKLSNETLNSLTSVRGFKSCNHLFVSARFGEISHFTVLVKDMLRIYLQLRMCFLNREERIKIHAPREHSMKFNLGRSWT